LSGDFDVIAIRHSGLYSELFYAMVARLKERYGSEIHLYCPRPEMADNQRKSAPPGLLASVNFITPAHPVHFPDKLDENTVVEQARSYEQRYGCTMNKFAVNDRHFGRGYAPTGIKNPRSWQSENSSYIQFLDAYNKYFDYWENEFETKGITLMLNPDWREAAVARANAVPFRAPLTARYQSYHYWMTDEYGYSSDLEAAYNSAEPDGRVTELKGRPHLHAELVRVALKSGRTMRMIKQVLRKLRLFVNWKLSGHSKGKLYLLRDELAYFIRDWRRSSLLQGKITKLLSELKDTPFVFFPLQVDPETGFQGKSPEYFNQHSAILSISRDLPAGVILAVKEHLYGTAGLRHKEFYAQLTAMKNVVLLDVREDGPAVVKKALAVATVNGTGAQEAALIGKPSIVFGRHNAYNVMPHVYVVTNENQIPGYIQHALSADFDHEQALRDSSRFVQAIEQTGFNLENLSHSDREGFNTDQVEVALERLKASLKKEENQRYSWER
jgi:hypothetical protein